MWSWRQLKLLVAPAPGLCRLSCQTEDAESSLQGRQPVGQVIAMVMHVACRWKSPQGMLI